MAERILEALKLKYDFLSIMLQSLEGAMGDISKETDPREVYQTLVKYVGEFPTRAMLQKMADEKGLGIRIRTEEDAIKAVELLSKK
ncbi:hypothetical protein [Thermococcus waiotapuensis]|uniref:Uncharacterized protein n=1 Tax=Thermococcus waiotapuensis TaxID=90909 RepID=A0AAE4T485_9EURY|nr:hypothetical protein [Thermococcus waiotapuensis]MDV3104511.1 hypothetical protein [Thermococcus waiotapuensis]